MGMDVYGINPKTNNGDYFRANVWYWRPLWQCVAYFCDDILSEEDIERGTYNDGYEYDETTALEISDKLENALKNGELHKFVEGREKFISEMEDKDKAFYSSYKFSINFVMDFAKFCEQSGGFSIC
jgi:hypothetical protein